MSTDAARETPFFFELGDERLFGVLHGAENPVTGVVFCHAFAEEKLWSHRVYVNFARAAAAAGFAVLRFDMRGEGDSARDFEATDIETRVADVRRAVQELRSRVPTLQRVFLVGHRLGGSIAVAAGNADGIAIWDPVPDGAEYFSQLLRSNLTTQMAIDGKVTRTREALIVVLQAGETVTADGYGLSAALHAQMSALLLAAPGFAQLPAALLLEVPYGEQAAPSAALAAMDAAHPSMVCQLAAEAPYWRETRQFHQRAPKFEAATLEWLKARAS